jgi:hypothetical protein
MILMDLYIFSFPLKKKKDFGIAVCLPVHVCLCVCVYVYKYECTPCQHLNSWADFIYIWYLLVTGWCQV